jgi:hypothetical protein
MVKVYSTAWVEHRNHSGVQLVNVGHVTRTSHDKDR